MGPTFADLSPAIVEHLLVGVVVWRLEDPESDESLHLVGANDAAGKMAGIDFRSWTGKPMREILPGTPPERRKFYADVIRTGTVGTIGEVSYRDGLGASRVFSVTAVPLRDGCVLVHFENLTEIKKNEAEARRLSSFLDAIVENIPNMVFVKEAKELRFERINRAGEELLGIGRAEMLGKNDYDFFPPDQAEFFQGLDRKTLDAGAVVEIPEEPIQSARGERILHTKKVPLRDEAGVPRFLLGISEDITERKRAEREILSLVERLEERRLELEAINLELDGFSYSVSHDLRAPLRAIAGFTRVLLEEHGASLDEEGKRVAGIVVKNTAKMGQLIDDLLKFSRLGRQSLEVSTVDMTALVESIAREIPVAGRSIDVCVGRLPEAEADPSLIRQVWTNLLDNAAKYTRDKSHALIEVEGRTEGGESVYSVKDNGVGFEPLHASKLFGVFERLHKQSEYEGTGVGLALVNRIVRRHGGWVRAEGKVDAGATFSFGLPRKGSN